MCTPLDLAKQRNQKAVIDYLQNQQHAQQANELPTNVLLNERADIEENVKSGAVLIFRMSDLSSRDPDINQLVPSNFYLRFQFS